MKESGVICGPLSHMDQQPVACPRLAVKIGKCGSSSSGPTETAVILGLQSGEQPPKIVRQFSGCPAAVKYGMDQLSKIRGYGGRVTVDVFMAEGKIQIADAHLNTITVDEGRVNIQPPQK